MRMGEVKEKSHQNKNHESKENTEKQLKQRRSVKRKEGRKERASNHEKLRIMPRMSTHLPQ